MKTFPKPEFFLGPQAQSLAGSSASPHYIFLDAAAINNLHTVFPLAPSKPQAALLSSLFRVSENRRIVLATTPIELMLLDHIKENPEDGNVEKPKLRELASLGRGGLAVQSYASMRSSWYSYQPFTLTDLATTPFKFGGNSMDITKDSGDTEQDSLLPAQVERMRIRIDALSACACLLKRYLPDCTMEFALLGSRMAATEIQTSISHELGPLGDLHVGNINLRALFTKLVDQSAAKSTYTDPIPHPNAIRPTFIYPRQELGPLRMDIRSIPQFALPDHFDAAPNKVIYLAYDTNAHSRLHRQLIDLSARFGPNIRLISLPTVAHELARGRGHEARERSLKSFLDSARSKVKRTNDLQFRPAPTMNSDGSLSMEHLKADNRICSEAALVMRQLVGHNPGRKVYFAFVTFDLGCYMLCDAIDSGGAQLLLPKVDKRDIKEAGKVIYNVLHPYLA